MQENQELPQGWIATSLGKLLAFEYGKALVGKDRNETGQINVFGSSGSVGKHTSAYVNSPCLIIGRKGNVGSIYISKEPCWPIDTAYFCLPPLWLDLQFTYHLLHHLQLSKLDKSTAIPGLNRNDAYSSEVLLPPLPEQRRIVTKLEELFSRWEAGVAALRHTQAQLKRYRQAVLHAAVTGELTRAWRAAHPAPVETGAALLARIRQERRAQWEAAQLAKRGGQLPLGDAWKKKYEEPAAPDTSELPELPEGWVWVKLDYLVSLITKGASPTWQGFKYVEDEQVLFVTSENVRSAFVDVSRPKYLEWAFNDKQKNSVLKKGDLLLNIVGASIGRAAMYDLEQSANINQAVALIRLTLPELREYVMLYLNSNQAIRFYDAEKVDVARANLSLADVANIPVPLPANELELSAVLQETQRRLSVLDELEHTLRAELTRAERLRQSILHRAFTGRLVPQDATDEPAAALLARLQAAGAGSAPAARGRGRKATGDTKQTNLTFSE